MINMAFMLLYMWEMWDATPVTHGHTDRQTVESRAVFSLSWIRNLSLNGWWSLGEVNIWVLSDYNGPRFSTLGLTRKSCKNRFHPQIKFQTYFFLFLHKLTASAPSLHNVVYHHHDHDQIKKMICDKGGVDQGRCWYGAVPIFTESLVKVDKHCLCLVFLLQLHNRIFSQLIIKSIQSVKIRFHNWL